MNIEAFTYHYVAEPYNFYNIQLEAEGQYHKMYLSARQIEGLDKDVPDAVAYLLRAHLKCQPVQTKTRTFDD